ncbi:hypothetical protein DPEC_G00353990 [Dallia pectoralis]|uniref:Uncharacterized protein n=1 Tax=Dallia pectoralis TaxID=75939 RepID=A0ACC2F2Q3_DALPE|nr:hypothetical protein DPEC_G00353990 [Dallia pectoralis]
MWVFFCCFLNPILLPVSATQLPEKGPTTGAVIGGIIGVILLLAIIGSVVALVRKNHNKMYSVDGPSRYRAPPPRNQTTVTSSSTDRLNSGRNPENDDQRPVDQLYYSLQIVQPSTDREAYVDEGYNQETEKLCLAGAPYSREDPQHNDVQPQDVLNQFAANDYHDDVELQTPTSGVTWGNSFVSRAMFV